MKGQSLKIVSTSGKGNFQIKKGSLPMFEVKYTSWFSGHAQTRFNGDSIEMKPGNFWQTKFPIIRNGVEAGEMFFHSRGFISILLFEERSGMAANFKFKPKGFWKSHYLLLDEADNEILRLQPKWVWRKFSYDYEIEMIDETFDEAFLIELLIYCGYACKVIQEKNAATTAAVS
jgi:hypothetical protein